MQSGAVRCSQQVQSGAGQVPDVWWYNAGSEDHLAIAYEPDEVFEARVEAFRLWLASRPERCIAVVTHHGFLLNLTGANGRVQSAAALSCMHPTSLEATLAVGPPTCARTHTDITCTLAPTPVLLCCQHSRGLWPRGELLVIHYFALVDVTMFQCSNHMAT